MFQLLPTDQKDSIAQEISATNTEDDTSFKKTFDRRKRKQTEHQWYIRGSIVPKTIRVMTSSRDDARRSKFLGH